MGALKLTVVGNLGRDPEVKTLDSGLIVMKLAVAANQKVKRKGEYVDETTWVSASMFGERAEKLAKYIHKGDQVTLFGRPEVRSYTSKDGEAKAELSILIDDIVLPTGGDKRRSESGTSRVAEMVDNAGDYTEDDVPF